jgi:ADP-ribosyl-[dinitrogen reductase] hydrolase
MLPTDLRARFRGCLLGLAVGDALGTTVEFRRRGTFAPVTDMIGGGVFKLAPGQWTDDTSMALCLADSLLECGFDLKDQIERYCRWHEWGYRSSTGRCFDIGNATRAALQRYRRSGDPKAGSVAPDSAGNGCIMRLAPVPMFFFPEEERAIQHAAESCLPTHAAEECLDSARLLARSIVKAFAGSNKREVIESSQSLHLGSWRVAAIASGAFWHKTDAEIRGSGYVVDCLEAALWSFANSDTFEAAVILAVNLGDDADTTAAVCGQLAGAFYGSSAIPPRWLNALHHREDITRLADRLYERVAPMTGV